MVHRLDDFGSIVGNIANGDFEHATSALILKAFTMKLLCLIPITIITCYDNDAAHS